MLGVIHADSFLLYYSAGRNFQAIVLNPNIPAENIQAVENFVNSKMTANSARPDDSLMARRDLAIDFNYASY